MRSYLKPGWRALGAASSNISSSKCCPTGPQFHVMRHTIGAVLQLLPAVLAIHGISARLNERLWTHPKIKTDANKRAPKLKRMQTDARNHETHVIAYNTPGALTTSAICREALASNVHAAIVVENKHCRKIVIGSV